MSNWIWEDCSSLYYRADYCELDCGWWYNEIEDDENAWWVTCDEFYSWEAC